MGLSIVLHGHDRKDIFLTIYILYQGWQIGFGQRANL